MLIDTNVWSELTRPRPEPRVVDFLTRNSGRCFLSTIVLAEMEYGIAKAHDPIRRERLIGFRNDAIARCEERILQPDGPCATIWGNLKAELARRGEIAADMDLLIAAQAIAANVPLVTRNLSDMARTGAVLINPWET